MLTSSDLSQIARLLRTVAEAERARLEDDWSTVTRLLDSVDPIEAFSLAAHVDVEVAYQTLPPVRPARERRSLRTPW